MSLNYENVGKNVIYNRSVDNIEDYVKGTIVGCYIGEDEEYYVTSIESSGECIKVYDDSLIEIIEGGGGAVSSVNGKTGAVVLHADDVGALPDDTVIPSQIGQLSDNVGLVHYNSQTLTDAQKAQARTNIGAGTYSKPSGGIPASDLADGVIPDVSDKVDKITNYGLAKIESNEGNYTITVKEGQKSSTNAAVVSTGTFATAMQQAGQALAAKANTADVYTKTEIDNKGYQTSAQVQSAIAAIESLKLTATITDGPSGGTLMSGTWSGATWEQVVEAIQASRLIQVDVAPFGKITLLYNLGSATYAASIVYAYAVGGILYNVFVEIFIEENEQHWFRLSIINARTSTGNISGADPIIEPHDNNIYNCGELTSLTIINPPASGAYSIVFTSGTTATTTAFPATILGLEDFAAEANTLYEINVLDNRAVVGSWAVTP